MRRIATRYRIFRVSQHNQNNFGHLPSFMLSGVNHEEYENEQDALDWIIANGDHRTLSYDYIVLPCMRVIQDQQ